MPGDASLDITMSQTARGPSTQSADRNLFVHTEAGATVRCETSVPIPRFLWERLKAYVEMIEPNNPEFCQAYWRDYANAPGWYYGGEAGEHGPFPTEDEARRIGPLKDSEMRAEYPE